MDSKDFIQELLVKFKVDHESIQQIQRSLDDLTNLIQQKQKESIQKSADGLREGLQISKEITQADAEQFVNAELYKLKKQQERLDAYKEYANRVEKDHADVAEGLRKRVALEERKIAEQQESILNPASLQKLTAGFSQLETTMMSIARILAPGLIGAASLVGFIGALKEASDQLRTMNLEVQKLQYLSGNPLGVGVAGAVSSATRDLVRMGFKTEDVYGATTTMLTGGMDEDFINRLGIRGGRAGGLTGALGGMTGFETMGALGTSTGLGIQGVAQAFVDLKRYVGTSDDGLIGSLQTLRGAADATNIPVKEYISGVIGMTKTNAKYGASLEQSAFLVDAFSKQIEAGSMTFAELTRIQAASTNLSMGSLAFMGQQISTGQIQSPELAKALQGTQPGFAQAAILKGEFQKDSMLGLRMALQSAQVASAGIVQQEMKGVATDEQRRAVEYELLRGMPSIGELQLSKMTNENFKELIDKIGDPKGFEIAMNAAMADPSSNLNAAAKATEKAAEDLRKSVGFWQGIMLNVKENFQDIVILEKRMTGQQLSPGEENLTQETEGLPNVDLSIKTPDLTWTKPGVSRLDVKTAASAARTTPTVGGPSIAFHNSYAVMGSPEWQAELERKMDENKRDTIIKVNEQFH